jgi:hypothetical protein
MTDDELSFWMVEAASYVFRASAETARAIDQQLTDGIVEFVRFTDLGGARVVYRRTEIRGMWESTPHNRQRDRAVTTAIAAESPPGVE